MSERLAGAWLAIPAAVIAALVAVASTYAPALALAAGAGAVVVGMVLANATALLLALIAAFPWDDALAFPTETVSVVKILGALVLLGYLIRLLASDEPLVLPAPLGWLAVFTVLVLVSTLLSPDLAASLNKALRYLLFASFFFLYLQLVRTRAAVRASLRVLLASLSVAALVALFGFLTSGSGLASGPVGDPNDFGYLLATSLPLAGYLIASDRRFRLVWVLATLVIAAALLATLSRGAIVGILALVVWAIATRRVPLGGVIAAAVAGAAILALAFTFWAPLIGERVQAKNKIAAANVQSREALWKGALRMASDHPLLGIGPDRFGDAAPDYVTDEPIGLRQPVVHNSYLEVMAELGVPALLLFLGFLLASWQCTRVALARFGAAGDRDGRRLAVAIQASFVVAVVAGAFISAQVIIPLWLLCALAAVVATTTPVAGRDAATPR
jgi:putative inorganic carbon (HCO3(-)) transporter